MQGLGASTGQDTAPFGARLPHLGIQHHMGHRPHMQPHSQAPVVTRHRAGFVCWRRRGLVDKSAAGRPPHQTSGVDGGMATTGSAARHSPFRSRLPVDIRRIPILLGAHHFTGSMRVVGSGADNAAAESFFGSLRRVRGNRRKYRTRPKTQADISDSIERGHNASQRQRPALQQEGRQRLPHLAV